MKKSFWSPTSILIDPLRGQQSCKNNWNRSRAAPSHPVSRYNDENSAQSLCNLNQIGHTLASHPSPFMQYILYYGAKPSQQVCGEGYDDEQIGKEVFELDARGSRPNGIFEYPYPLPIFSPLDDPQPCLYSDGSWRKPQIFLLISLLIAGPNMICLILRSVTMLCRMTALLCIQLVSLCNFLKRR